MTPWKVWLLIAGTSLTLAGHVLGLPYPAKISGGYPLITRGVASTRERLGIIRLLRQLLDLFNSTDQRCYQTLVV